MTPFFSICIPQYNRTSFLKEAIRSFAAQSFTDFELCISDGGSTDGRIDELDEFCRDLKLRYRLARSERNLRYDENLRSAISLSAGRYLLLMGNDDAFADSECLQYLHDRLTEFPTAAVAITNYMELGDRRVYRRMTSTGLIGHGPQTAADTFRHYAFVSGIILDGAQARAAATDRVDGSEMYQMYLGARQIASGGGFLSLDRILIHKDIQIADETVDSYRTRRRESRWSLQERRLPLSRVIDTVASGIEAGDPGADHRKIVARLARQLYLFTYPFWVMEYRRVQSYAYAIGVYRALKPSSTCGPETLYASDRAAIWVIYLVQGALALVTPIAVFDLLRSRLYRLAKKRKG